ncbi:MAG: NYN domain-containing protein [Mesorhizobium sp.]|nr:MAG: NYN domain-containing protein [Mesorhizobium sp.]
MNNYAFVDGAGFRALIESTKAYFQIPTETEFDFGNFFNGRGVARTFFYDALPDQKRAQTPAEYEKLVTDTAALFDRINAYPGLHVKSGLSRHRPTRGGQEQKGVDILLAIDLYRHAVNGLDHAHIFANDGDFYPVLEALHSTKTRSTLSCIRGKTPKYLYELADEVEYINELDLAPYFRGSGKKYSIGVFGANDQHKALKELGYTVSGSLVDENGSELYRIYESKKAENTMYILSITSNTYFVTKADPRVAIKHIEKTENKLLKFEQVKK